MNNGHKFTSFLIILCFIIFAKPTYASFNKYVNNPVLNKGDASSWEGKDISAPFVLRDSSKFKMWYYGTKADVQGSIGYATSDDGVNWQKHPANPVLSKDITDPSELEVSSPIIIKVGNEYKMWYLSTTSYMGQGNEVFRIKHAMSIDGISWQLHGFVFRRSNSWESEGVVPSSVLYENGIYKMWYGARNNQGIWRTGYAFSTDGTSWTRNLNPILQASLPWEGNNNGDASVIKIDGVYHIYYHAGQNVPLYLGHATSTDGINWTKDLNPILDRGGFGAFDRNMIAAPSVLRVTNKLRLYYAGQDGANWRIGLAEEVLPVPYISQTDPLWGSLTYNNAPAWADNKNYVGIDSYGCAITSATMILKSYNVNKTSGNPAVGLPVKDLTPGTLNEWLKSRSDGYIGNGFTNFQAIATMTREVHEVDHTSPKLEYVNNDSSMDEVLASGYLPILKLKYSPSLSGTHFVVGTEKAGPTYSILDPRHSDRTTLAPHYPTVKQINHFKPTDSDFSYFIFAVNPEVNITLKDQNNNEVGNQSIEEPLADLVNGTDSGADSLITLYFKQPPAGEYRVEISSPTGQSYQLDSYIYNPEGVVQLQTNNGIVGPNKTDTYSLNFSSAGGTIEPAIPEVSFASVKSDITLIYELEWINKESFYRYLWRNTHNAERMVFRNHPQRAIKVLEQLLKRLEKEKDKKNQHRRI